MKGVDREAKVIRGYSVMSLGEAKGHGMVVDGMTLDQLVQLGNASSGIKTRVRHPDPSHDGFGRLLGKSRNFRREGDKVLADLHLSDAAFKSPDGDLGSYVLDLASSDDDAFGASPEVRSKKEHIPGSMPAMRLKQLMAIAIVDDPATNTGFFSCLSTGDDDMADDAKVTELTAERDLLAEEVSRLKTENTKLTTDLTAKGAELSVAKAAATTEAIASERARVGDILALCNKAGKTDLSAKYIADGTVTGDVQKAILDMLCAKNGAIDGAGAEGSDAANLSKDPDAAFKAEYATDRVVLQRAGISEADFLASRRISAGTETLLVR